MKTTHNQDTLYAVSYVRDNAEVSIFDAYETLMFHTATNMRPSKGDRILLAAKYDNKKFAMLGTIERLMTDQDRIDEGLVDDAGRPSTYGHVYAIWDSEPVEITTDFECAQAANILIRDRDAIYEELTGVRRLSKSAINKLAVAERKKVRDAKRAAKVADKAAKIAAKEAAKIALEMSELIAESTEIDWIGRNDGVDMIIESVNNGRRICTREEYLTWTDQQIVNIINQPKIESEA